MRKLLLLAIIAAWTTGSALAQPGTLSWDDFNGTPPGIDVRIEGPEEIAWNEQAEFRVVMTVDGTVRGIYEFVDWQSDGPVKILNPRSKTATLKLKSNGTKDKYATDTLNLKVSFEMQTTDGKKRVSAERSVLISSVARECEGLMASLETAREKMAALDQKIAAILTVPVSAIDKEGVAKAIEEKQNLINTKTDKLEKQKKAVAKLVAAKEDLLEARAKLENLRTGLERAMPESALLLAAHDRYKNLEPLGRKIDKVNYVRAVLGREGTSTMNAPDGVLESDVLAAEQKVLRHFVPQVAYALQNLGGLVTMLGGAPGAGNAGKWYASIEVLLDDNLLSLAMGVIADQKVDAGSVIKSYTMSQRGLATLDTSLNGLNRSIALFEQAHAIDSQSRATEEARAALIIAMTGAYNQVLDRLTDMEREQVVQKISKVTTTAQNSLRENEDELAGLKKELADLERSAEEAKSSPEPSFLQKLRAAAPTHQRDGLRKKIAADQEEYDAHCVEPDEPAATFGAAASFPPAEPGWDDEYSSATPVRWPVLDRLDHCGSYSQTWYDQVDIAKANGCTLSRGLWSRDSYERDLDACFAGDASYESLGAKVENRNAALKSCLGE